MKKVVWIPSPVRPRASAIAFGRKEEEEVAKKVAEQLVESPNDGNGL